MADETVNEDTTATEELEQPDMELEQDDLPDELPEDPVALKEIAAKALSAVKSAKQRAADALSEKERLEDNLEEQRTKASYWAVKAQEAEDKAKATPEAKATPPSKEDDPELVDLITNGMKLSDLKRMWQQDAMSVADWKAAQVTQQGAHARVVVAEYPDLTNDNSPLTKATIAEMEAIERQTPGMADQVKFELATRRAADRLGIQAKSQAPTNGKEEAERARRRAGQGGPTGKATPAKGAVVITDQDRAMARKMNGGQDVPDKVLIEAKKRLQDQSQQARA